MILLVLKATITSFWCEGPSGSPLLKEKPEGKGHLKHTPKPILTRMLNNVKMRSLSLGALPRFTSKQAICQASMCSFPRSKHHSERARFPQALSAARESSGNLTGTCSLSCSTRLLKGLYSSDCPHKHKSLFYVAFPLTRNIKECTFIGVLSLPGLLTIHTEHSIIMAPSGFRGI